MPPAERKVIFMAEVEKHTSEAMDMIMKHNERKLKRDSNTDIDRARSRLNYAVPLDHGGLPDRKYFKQLVEESYLYGRGSRREADAITAFSWVITLPKEVSDYTANDRPASGYIHPDEERQFFEAAVRFVSDRYGAENVVHNKVHYDEAGQPHIHVYVVPRKDLDHGQVHFKTKTTRHAVRTGSGRYEYERRYMLSDGTSVSVQEYEKYLATAGTTDRRIPVKNYAKISDYYDTKLSCKEIINTAELKHFHPDFAEYLRKNGLPGADGVHTGVTGGKNISVKSMKEFTRTTGLTIDEARVLTQEKEALQEQVSALKEQIKEIRHERDAEIAAKDREIEQLKKEINISKEAAMERDAASGWGSFKGWGDIERKGSTWTQEITWDQ